MNLPETSIAPDQTDSDNLLIELFPAFNFRQLPLSKAAREQLARRYEAVRSGKGDGRSVLQAWILDHAYDQEAGAYVPAAFNVYLKGKLPDISEHLPPSKSLPSALRPSYFTNPLMIPRGYGHPDFNENSGPRPKHRLTNIGYLIVTLEYDCKTPAQFEETLAWSRGETPPFARVDKELSQIGEYRGYSIVFAGNRSIHHHCLFSTAHLERAPHQAMASDRLARFENDADLLTSAHETYFDRCKEIFKNVLRPSLEPDPRLRLATQWRRMPWGIRTLEKDSKILGLPKGTRVPQIVIKESIKKIAPRGNAGFLVPPTFSPEPRQRSSFRSSTRHRVEVENIDHPALVRLLQEDCCRNWGQEYPLPIDVDLRNDDAIIYFRNNAEDRNPSTVCIGDYRRLLLNGSHDFGDRPFLLSDLAEALINYFSQGARALPGAKGGNDRSGSRSHRLSPLNEIAHNVAKRFSRAPSDLSDHALRAHYRSKLREALFWFRVFKRIIILAGEGIGKTSTLLPILLNEAQDDAYNHIDGRRRFAAIASRSHEQAERKAEEFRNSEYLQRLGASVLVWRSFWSYYEEVCARLESKPIPKIDFREGTLTGLLREIKLRQPRVFEELEAERKALWSNCSFDGQSTILLMTYRGAQTWDTGTLTKTWHHPRFDPNKEDDSLHHEFVLSRLVLDDPEPDDFFYLLSESRRRFLQETKAQEKNKNWRNIERSERIGIYRELLRKDPLPVGLDFDTFDEQMRLDLPTLDELAVDYDKIPFGYDHTEEGIYRKTQGDKYYLAPKNWLFKNRNITVLTTERLVVDAVMGSTTRFRQRGGRAAEFLCLSLDHMPGVYPVNIPARIDARARSETIRELVEETSNSDNTIVISDMAKGVPSVMNFQKMKGVNGLENMNINIVVTNLNPAKYAELNVTGQWLGTDSVIARYYQDQISQAIGRNRGFRHSFEKPTETIVITSERLWASTLSRLWRENPRYQLFRDQSRASSGSDGRAA